MDGQIKNTIRRIKNRKKIEIEKKQHNKANDK